MSRCSPDRRLACKKERPHLKGEGLTDSLRVPGMQEYIVSIVFVRVTVALKDADCHVSVVHMRR